MGQYACSSRGLFAPIKTWLSDQSVSEILINKPQEVFVEIGGDMQKHQVLAYDEKTLHRLFKLIANENQAILDAEHPILSGSIDDGSRVQLVVPPVANSFVLSIRKYVKRNMTLDLYHKQGFYNGALKTALQGGAFAISAQDKQLRELYQQQSWPEFIKKAIHYRKNIVISGGTSSGKTTFLNACLAEIPLSDRIIILEDTAEVNIPHSNQVGLLAQASSVCRISLQALLQCCLRLRPDRIIVGEIRGREIIDFIAASSTGHEGSITTIHANNTHMALMRMVQLYKLNNLPFMTDADILREINAVVDVIVQLKRVNGVRKMVEVWYKHARY